MKRERINYLLCLLFFTVLAAITFRCVFGENQVFAASDLNIGRLAYIKSILPDWFFGHFQGVELFGISGSGISLFKTLLAIFPLEFFANTFYGATLVCGSMAMVWFLRLWNRSWAASVFGALIAFWVNSIMLATGGHAYKMEVLVFSVLALGLIEKAVRAERIHRTAGFSVLAGIVVGLMMIEQQDVGLLAGLFVGPYALFRLVQVRGRAVLHWIAVLVPIGGVGLLLAGSMMLRSYEHYVVKAAAVHGDPAEKWDFITQWSMVPEEWPELVALGWSGWKTGDPKGPYWGKLGQSANWESTKQGFQNFKLTSNYFGIIPFLLGLFGMAAAFRNRKSEEAQQVLFWSVAGLMGFWLAFGKFSILYKLFYHLPLVGNIRAPIKLLDNFQICLGIVSAYGLDCLLGEGKAAKPAKVLWAAAAVLGGLMLFAGLRLLAFPSEQAAEFSSMGFGGYADAMVQNMANGWLHAAGLALLAAGFVFMVWKGVSAAKWAAALFVIVLAADSLFLTSHYFEASDISVLKRGNVVTSYIKKNQGNERAVFLDSQGIYNQWIASDGPFLGLNLFNVWQSSRMPADYKEFLGTVGRNQIRLWELASIKYVAAPAGILQQLQKTPALGNQFQPVLNYQIPTAQGMRPDVLLEFKGAIPRFALFYGWESVPLEKQCKVLASPQYDAHSALLLDPASHLGNQTAAAAFQPLDAEITKRRATAHVQTDSDAIVRFSQYYQPDWRVFVDGKPVKLLRVDYLCLGVAVPPGEHEVEFRCMNGSAKLIFVLAVLAGSLLLSVWLLLPAEKSEVA